jgi:hypothetical protein
MALAKTVTRTDRDGEVKVVAGLPAPPASPFEPWGAVKPSGGLTRKDGADR